MLILFWQWLGINIPYRERRQPSKWRRPPGAVSPQRPGGRDFPSPHTPLPITTTISNIEGQEYKPELSGSKYSN